MNPGRAYAEAAVSQVPRILSMQDRNAYSPSYGCFDRIYWLDKSIDFPSSILQLNADNLAMVYSIPFEGNPYYGEEKVRDWAFAGMRYWTEIQNGDGSFDEFYPNERGWAGPTGFLLYSMLDAYVRLEDEMPAELERSVVETAHRAADYLAKNDELGVLANHHAMAVMPIYYASVVLDREDLLDAFDEKMTVLEGFQSPEGWLLEYDGADLGYLSATVSFLGKLYRLATPELRQRILDVVEPAIEFSSHFLYPDDSYGGSIGSRQTLHFYPHGYRIFADEIPIAGRMADLAANAVRDGKMAPPSSMPWRYVGYRIQEYLMTAESYREEDSQSAGAGTVTLPRSSGSFQDYFPDAGMYVSNRDDYYLAANMARGGVFKLYDDDGPLITEDGGIIGELADGTVVSSQWIDEEYDVERTDDSVTVRGRLNEVPFTYPTPAKMMAFRSLLLTVGRSTTASYWLKGAIRKLFITDTNRAAVGFERTLVDGNETFEVRDTLDLGESSFDRLSVGGAFSIRYVPQSRYFSAEELQDQSVDIGGDELVGAERLTVTRQYDPTGGDAAVDVRID